MPTVVNNVETLSHIPTIILNGADWYKSIGTKQSPGTKIFTISGDVNNPGYFEVEMGVRLKELVYHLGGGIKDNKKFKTALIGGAAGTFAPQSFLDVGMDFESLQEKDAVLGSGAIIVMAEDKSILDMLHSILRFFGHESCGKCVPCRVGTRQLLILLEKIITDGHDTNSSGIDALLEQAELMAKTSLCPLGQSPVLPIKSAIRYFRNELEQTTN